MVVMLGLCGGLIMGSLVEEVEGWDYWGREFSFVVGGLRGWLV